MKDAKALLSFAVLMASLAPVIEATSAVVPRDGEATLIVADAAVEFSARGILLSWKAGLHLLLFLLPFLLWLWRARRGAARDLDWDVEDTESQTELGGDAL